MPFLKAFLLAGLVPIGLLVAVGAYIQPVRGDLTRIGMVSERSWGWNKPRPIIERVPNEATPAAGVIVIGDSFSLGQRWQSIAQRKAGIEIATYHWDKIGPPTCLGDAIRTLRSRHPAARHIVLQSIERNFVVRFSDWSSRDRCPESIPPVERLPPPTLERRKTFFDVSAGLPDARYAFEALLAEDEPYDRTTRRGEVVITPLTRDDLFSNRRSGWLLFFAGDLVKQDWTDAEIRAAVDNIAALSSELRASGLQMLVMVVPDKSTVYAPFLKYEHIRRPTTDPWQALHEAGVASIPLKVMFQREATRRVDLYLPNDTHVGNDGWTMLGDAVADFIRRGPK